LAGWQLQLGWQQQQAQQQLRVLVLQALSHSLLEGLAL
jgi:hypothetical protein